MCEIMFANGVDAASIKNFKRCFNYCRSVPTVLFSVPCI